LLFYSICDIIFFVVSEYPGVAQLVARLTGGQEAVSSSLATRTISKTALLGQKWLGSAIFSFSKCFSNEFKKLIKDLAGFKFMDRTKTKQRH
jgi:hypothetical protein